MSDRTAHARRSVTKVAKGRKGTKAMVSFVFFVFFVAERQPSAVPATPQQQAQTQAQQRPVFRGGTHFVRVDAYPIVNGRIVEGLKPEDFEILEDGRPQTIDSFDFVRFDTFTPETKRRNPSSRREGFEMAADPRYRVSVIVVDLGFSKGMGVHAPIENIGLIQQPLVNFIDRVIGANDLFGLLTSRNTVKDLVLGQKTLVVTDQVKALWRASFLEPDPAPSLDDRQNAFGCLKCREAGAGRRECKTLLEAFAVRYHADQSYTLLRDVIAQLGAIREERKNIVLVSNQLPRWLPDEEMYDRLRAPEVPKAGIDSGRVTLDDPHRSSAAGYSCAADVNRLPTMDFEKRYEQVLTEAQRANTAFHVITPSGLQAPWNIGDQRILAATNNDLRKLASETGGIAIVDTNDLEAGMRRIADDMQAYYVLGYYTTNTKFDGGIRRITVRMKADGPSTGLRAGQSIRARREYRAPTQAEIAAMANRPVEPQAESGPPAVIGEPVVYRVSPRQAAERVSLPEFVRADRVRVQWPVLAPLDRREARLLDGAGKPLPVELAVSEDEAGRIATVELALAPLTRGVYAIELTAGSGARTERRRLTFLMK